MQVRLVLGRLLLQWVRDSSTEGSQSSPPPVVAGGEVRLRRRRQVPMLLHAGTRVHMLHLHAGGQPEYNDLEPGTRLGSGT